MGKTDVHGEKTLELTSEGVQTCFLTVLLLSTLSYLLSPSGVSMPTSRVSPFPCRLQNKRVRGRFRTTLFYYSNLG